MIGEGNSYAAFIGDGASHFFPFTFFYIDQTDLLVTVAPAGGTPVSQVLGIDYTVIDAPVDGARPNGGSVRFVTAPDPDTTILVSRRIPRDQDHVYSENDPFPAKSHELALDKLTALLQEVMHGYQAVADGPPTKGVYQEGDWFIARKFRLGSVMGWIYVDDGSGQLVWAQFGLVSLLQGVL